LAEAALFRPKRLWRRALIWARFAADFSRLPIGLDLRAISFAEGLRAGLSSAALVALSDVLAEPALMQAALAALFTCMCDPGGPVRRRVPALLAFTATGSAALVLGGVLRGFGYPAIPLAALVVFALSFVRIYGQAAQQVGNLTTVVFFLALDRPWPDAPSALRAASLFAAGSLWAVLLTLVMWRLHPYRPSRRAVAEVLRALARLSDDLRAWLAHRGEAGFDEHLRRYRRDVRESIEQARVIVLDTLRQRGAQSFRAAQSVLRLEAVEQIFGAMIALEDRIEDEDAAPLVPLCQRALRLLAPLFAVLARHVIEDCTTPPPSLPRAMAQIKALAIRLAPEEPLRRLLLVILERIEVVITVSEPATARTETTPYPALNWRARLLDPLRANLAWASLPLRHALRAGLVTLPALAITFRSTGSYQHWLTITLVLTLQPYFALTMERAVQRIVGTVIGGFFATGLAYLCPHPWQMALAIFPLSVAALSVRVASFGLYITLLTPLVVLLSELGHQGTTGAEIAIIRAVYTLIGGGLALLSVLLLWPSFEPRRLADELRAVLRAHAAYARAAFGRMLGEGDAAQAEEARRRAGIASNNLEAALARALHEPKRSEDARHLDIALVVDAALRRLAGRLAAIELSAGAEATPDPALISAWREWVSGTLEALAQDPKSALAPPPPRPAGEDPLSPALGRLERQIQLIAGAMRRW
jgi:uncharacterized membrane protein YccC